MTRLLFIDDEMRKAQALINYFEEICEWSVDIAPGPDQAMELLQKTRGFPYDVIILDVMMDPGTIIPRERTTGGRDTGLFLLDMIIQLTSRKVPIVLYSARTDLAHLKHDDRVATFIQKPSSAHDIVRQIEDVLKRSPPS